MSKVSKQQLTDEKGSRIFESVVDRRLFDVQSHGQHDKTPDVDGTIRLRDGQGRYLNKYLHYQLKSAGEIKGGQFYCRRKVVEYLLETNIPTVLIVVDVGKRQVFWYFLSRRIAQGMGLSKNKRGSTIDVSPYELRGDNQEKIHEEWQNIAHESDYERSKSALAEIAGEFEANVRSALGVLFLLQKVQRDKVGEIWKSLLGICTGEAEIVVQKLVEKQLIIGTTNYYLVEDEKMGRECLEELVEQLGREGLGRIFGVAEDKGLMLGQLAEVYKSNVRQYFRSKANELVSLVKSGGERKLVFEELGFLRKYSFRVRELTLRIVRLVVRGAKLQRDDSVEQGRLVFGLYDEDSEAEMVLRCVDLLKDIRYLRTEGVFRLLVSLYGSANATVRGAAQEGLEELAGFNIYALTDRGVFAQKIVFDEVDKWGERRVKSHLGLLCAIASKVLQPSYSGHHMEDYRTVALFRGSLVATGELVTLRGRAIRLLERLYWLAGTLDEKHSVLGAFEEATKTPHATECGEKLRDVVHANTEEVIRFYTSIVEEAENETVRVIEKHLGRISRRFGDSDSLKELRSRIDGRVGYQIYRTFVGYDTDTLLHRDWREARRMRQARLEEILGAITTENFEEWGGKLVAVASSYGGSSLGEFGYFEYFLTQLGARKPRIALRLAAEKERELEPFLASILAGVWGSEARESGRKILRKWIREDGEKLETSAQVLGWKDVYDGPLIGELIAEGKRAGSAVALNTGIGKLVEKFDGGARVKALVLTALRALTRLGNTDWVDRVWDQDENKKFLSSLNDAEIGTVLRNLVLRSEIDYRAELLLGHIGEQRPREVMRFLMARVEEEVRGAKEDRRYKAIPYNFDEVNKSLGKHAEVVVGELLIWRRKREWRYGWEAEHLVEKIFPEFDVGLEQALIGLIKSKERGIREMILGILSAYKGQVFLHGICKEFVKAFGDEGEYATRLLLPLSRTGVVRGQYGFVKAYKKRREEMQPWKSDSHKGVRRFGLRFEEYIEGRIADEQMRADEEDSLLKRGLR